MFLSCCQSPRNLVSVVHIPSEDLTVHYMEKLQMDHYWSTYHSTDRGRHCYLPVFHAGEYDGC